MKLFKTFLIASCLATLTTLASAQGSLKSIPAPSGGWAELSLQYSFCSEYEDTWADAYDEFNVYGVAGSLAFPILNDIPVYARANLGLIHSTNRNMDEDYVDSYSYYTSLLPSAEAGYMLNIYKSISLFPYFGLVSRLNLYGRDVFVPEEGAVRARDRFKDVYDDDHMRRFQLGWKVGAELHVSSVLVGLFMTNDLTHVYAGDDPTRSASLGFKVGYKF